MTSLSKFAVELCALLVNETYGDLTSRIFTILLRRGRLPIAALCRHTKLSSRQCRHGLAVLIQQDLVYHNLEPETNITYYEANHGAAYKLVRSGKIVEIVETRFGAPAREVVTNLFQLGHTKVVELVAAYKAIEEKPVNGTGHNHTTNGTNGVYNQDKVRSTEHLHAILIDLLEAGLLEVVDERSFRSPTDTYNMAEREVIAEDGPAKGIKGKVEFLDKIRRKLRDRRDDVPNWRPKGWVTNKKGVNGASRINGVAVNGNHAAKLDLQLTLRVNYEKCAVALRNQRLVELVKIRLGETTAQVYAQVLLLLEPSIPRCQLDENIDEVGDLGTGPSVTTTQILAHLSDSVDLRTGIGKIPTAREGNFGNSARSKKRTADDADQMDAEDDDLVARPSKRPKVTFEEDLPRPDVREEHQSRTVQAKNHLSLLAVDRCGFLKKVDDNNYGTWSVDYETLSKYMRDNELDTMVHENYGETGHRLVRMMKKVGKLEEKMIPNIAMIKQGEVRTKLAEMQMAGVVDIQEVPRDAAHTVARTIFLWHFDTDRVSTLYLAKLHKSMSRCFQRLEIEKRDVADILTALQRQDMKGLKPEEVLEEESLKRLRKFQKSEDLLLTQVGRLDGLVGVFQDF